MSYPPGLFLLEEMHERGWSRKDMAEKSGLSVRRITALVFYETRLNEKDAAALSRAFGTGKRVWLNLERVFGRKVED